MRDEPTSREDRPGRVQLVNEVRASLRAAAVYAAVLSDRFELMRTAVPPQLDAIPGGVLVQLAAVSEAFQGGARHTLYRIDPELARNAQVLAEIARGGAGKGA
jgi:hypothetical protein